MDAGQGARNAGHGKTFLAHIEDPSRARGASSLYLAVMQSNPKGRAFWEREGFRATELTGTLKMGDREQELHRLSKKL